MGTARSYLVVGLSFLAVIACKQAAHEVAAPAATDSVRVVGTFVSAKALMVGSRPADIVALAVDPAGNVYAADRANNLIRKISPSGDVSTYAGSGGAGYKNGVAASAQFNGLASLAIDKAGNLYAGEGFDNTCIRKISPDGSVSTFAGKPFDIRVLPFNPETSPDGPDTSARFIVPAALAFDSDNNLFVSDIGSVNRYSSNAVRKITPDGYVRTIAGYTSPLAYQGRVINNAPLPYRFQSLAVNKANILSGIDYSNRLVYQIAANGDMSVLVNTRSLYLPDIILYDWADNLLVSNGFTIWQIAPGGLANVLTGDDQRGFVNDSLKRARFGYISALAVDAKRTLYIADRGNQCIRRVRLN